MKKYMIAFDLDGTLLPDNKIVTEVSKNYIKKLNNDGHKVVIATGRPYSWMKQLYFDLELTTPIVNTNGGTIHHPLDKNFETINLGMDKEIVKDICSNNQDSILAGFFNYNEKIYYSSMPDNLRKFITIDDSSILVQGPLHEIIDVNPGGVLLLVKKELFSNFKKYVINRYEDTISIRVFIEHEDEYLCEFYQKATNKAKGLEYILNYYNMTNEDLIAIGDADNDIEMIEYAYVGVAMANSHEEVLQKAKYITRTDNNEDGAVLFLDHFLGYNTMK